jgi:hypothetical protein
MPNTTERKQPHSIEIKTLGDRRAMDGSTTTYRAVCTTCGWTGRRWRFHSDATQDGDEHAAIMARADL